MTDPLARAYSPDRTRTIAAWTLFAIVAFHLVTIRDGHGWHDDFAAYISHARNLTGEKAYGDTGYIYDAQNPHAGPEAYPPVFPALLIPFAGEGEPRLWPMKAEQVALLGIWLALVLWWFRQRDETGATIVVALLGFSPFISLLKDNVLSDIAFAAAFTATLMAADTEPEDRSGGGVGLLALLAFGVRTVGFVLIPALWLDDLVRRRRITWPTLIATGTFVVGAGAITVLVGGDGGYADNLRLSSFRLTMVNAWRYLRSLEGLVVNGRSAALATVLAGILVLLVLIGLVRRLRRDGPSVVEWAIVTYGALIAVWPAFQSLRFLLPVLPFLFAYAIEGLDAVSARVRLKQGIARAALVGVFLLSYAGAYPAMGFRPVAEGVETDTARELFGYLRANTDEQDVVLFPRPRAMALYAGVRSVALPREPQDIADQIERFDVTLVVSSPIDPAGEQYARANKRTLRRIFDNADFAVYRVRRR